ncbi:MULTISPECIES: TadE/TadG family type IV pilus assembly protein [Bacillus]|uniref:Uncharacterized protein n=2 Tax=Bacillus thuringiensis TaxID=1428 RepID=A0AAP4Q656_BACTU|nr:MULTISPECIES: hypothetical protein [Bacillus]MEC0046479.1 hypothetical protein [Bacillus cereus]AFV21845.1 hypothetical protein BTB_502p05400 [Bacillus thuringiensis Bt407]EEM25130.1 hypothetical protein bthur0002_57720 [Bacillus thuringiensis Bt407]ERI00978.1 Flp pilus assembly protein TadG [Bacillus thuringiensis T01-328]MBN6707742.1 hypothetical protein [Bacillus thuringiensis]
MKLNKKIKTFLENKKGVATIEIAICAMLFIIAIGAFIDLSAILSKINSISSTNAYVSRVVGAQGGVKTRTPENFKGEYIHSKELYQNVKNSLERSGLKESDWSMYIDGRRLTSSINVPLKDYGNEITIKLKTNLKWDLLSNFIPGDLTNNQTSERTVVSSFKVRTGDVKSEYKQ